MISRLRRWSQSSAEPAPEIIYKHHEVVTLTLLLVFALALRIAAAILFPSVHHPDETFQYWEQGHRLAFGYGMVPWEYRTGIRSYVIPAAIAGVMELVSAAGGGVAARTIAVQALLSTLSLSIVATAFAWGRRAAGMSAAVLAGALACFWFELIYFAAKPLTESIAASLLFPAGYLLMLRHSSQRLLILGGVLLGLTFVVRFQLAPAISVIALTCLAVNGWRRSIPAAAATLAVILAGGLVDWITLGSPFQSVWLNFVINAVEGKASTYGIEPPHWYFLQILSIWAGFVGVMLVLVAAGLKRAPTLLAVALVVVLAHSAIAHKEYRFVLPALPFVLTLAGIGMAHLYDAAAQAYFPARRNLGLAFLLLCLVLTSANLAAQPAYQSNWNRDADGFGAFTIAAGVEQACGIGLANWYWVDTPGYRGLGRDIPIYPLRSEARALEMSSAFNVLLRRGQLWDSSKSHYEDVGCSGDICVAVRLGGCTPMPAETINPVLVESGQ